LLNKLYMRLWTWFVVCKVEASGGFFCQCRNDPSGFVKGREFCNSMGNC
jgi:hypothetical protein